jgi:uncharacterized membrane protein
MLPHEALSIVLTANASSVLPVLLASFVAPILLVAILFHFLPEVTRRDIFFAVTVDPSFRRTREAQLIVRKFRIAVWIHSALAAAIVLAGFALQNPVVSPWIPLIGIFWQLAAVLAAFLRARNRAMPQAASRTTQREAELAPRAAGSGTGQAIRQSGPFAILVAGALYLAANWQRIPERFPVHWGYDGQPNGWSTRSFGGVYGPLLIGFCVCAVIELFTHGIAHWTRQIDATRGAQAEARFRRIQVNLLIVVQYFIAILFCGIPFLPLRANPEEQPPIGGFLLGTAIFLAIVFALLIRTGQGGANLMKAGASSDILPGGSIVGDRTPDQCWRAGLFYVNRDDPAVLVEKRFGIGYTLNFGRPAAWLLLASILALTAVPIAIAVLTAHPH